MTDATSADTAPAALLPNGLSDLLPPDAVHESALIGRLTTLFAAHGYDRVKPPLVEFEETLLSGPGEAVSTQTFRMMDPVSRRMLGLRADMTPQVARIASTRLAGAVRPLRLSYSGQVLRLKGGDLRPERQFTQAGFELIGAPQPAADAEAAMLATEVLLALGIKEPVIDLGLPTLMGLLLDETGLTAPPGSDLRQALDRKDRTGLKDAAGAVADRLLPLLAAPGNAEDALAAAEDFDLPEAGAALIQDLRAVVAAVAEVFPDVPITVDFAESRGFEYHTGLSMTLLARGVRGELGRGGRYRLGADHTGEEATGVTFFLDSLARGVGKPPAPVRVYLPYGTPVTVGRDLRADGKTTIAGLSPDADQEAEAAAQGCTAIWRGGALTSL